MQSNYRFLLVFLVLLLYASFSQLGFVFLHSIVDSGIFLNIAELFLFYFGIFIIAFLAIKTDRITVSLLSRENLVYSFPVLISLIIGEFVILVLGGSEHQNVEIVTVLFLPIIAFSEEYMFRGYFQNAIRKKHKWYDSLVLTNIMFALLHVPSNIINRVPFSKIIVFFISQATSGFLFSLMYLISDNLLILILVHGFHDLTLFYFPTIPNLTFYFFIWAIPFSITLLLYRSRLKKQVKTN